MPAFTAAVQSLPDDVFPLSRRLLRHYGYFPTTTDNHVGEYIPWAASVIGTAGYDMARFALRRETLTSRLNRASDDLDVARDLLTEPTHEMKVENSAATLIADIVLKRTTTRPSFILPNDGLIRNLPRHAAVETAGIVDDGVIRGRAVELPDVICPLVAREVEIQRLSVRAAIEGSRELALDALLLDPMVTDANAAEQFLDDILTEHAHLLPRFGNRPRAVESESALAL